MVCIQRAAGVDGPVADDINRVLRVSWIGEDVVVRRQHGVRSDILQNDRGIARSGRSAKPSEIVAAETGAVVATAAAQVGGNSRAFPSQIIDANGVAMEVVALN